VAGVAFASTVLAKPWIFASVLAAMAVVLIVFRRDPAVRNRLLMVGAASVVAAAPLLVRAIRLSEDTQVTFEAAFFPIPLVMAERIGIRDWLMDVSTAAGASGAARGGLAALLALPVFLLGTLGSRAVGLPSFWRALRQPSQHDPTWPLLAWTVVTAFLASSFIVSVPYHESQQIHQFAMFLFALFAAQSLFDRPTRSSGGRSPRPSGRRILLIGAVILMAVPGPLQYLHRKWTDREHVIATASRDELAVVQRLQAAKPEETIVLHDRPNDPTLLGVLAERRSVLAWAGYVRGSEARRADIEAFFGGADTTSAVEMLRRYRPTHIVVYRDRDRVDPTVIEALELVMRSGAVELYRVPERLR
jgi:hypothetical protein